MNIEETSASHVSLEHCRRATTRRERRNNIVRLYRSNAYGDTGTGTRQEMA